MIEKKKNYIYFFFFIILINKLTIKKLKENK
jgi:hypothetical protein